MNFKNLDRCNVFKKCVKKTYPKQNFNCLMFFKSVRPVCYHLHFEFHKKTTPTGQNPFFLEKSNCAFLTKNLSSKGQLFQNTTSLLPIKMHTFRQKPLKV